MTAPTATNQAPRYPFARMRERIHAHPRRVLDFAFGSDRPVPPRGVLEIARGEGEAATRRASTGRLRTFMECAAAMLEREYAVRVEPDSILPAPSGRAAIAGVAISSVRAGDRVLLAEPVYPTLRRIVPSLGADVRTVWLDPERSFGPDPEAVQDAGPSVRLAAFSYPNNPTGALCPPELATLTRSVAARGGIVFNDAVYAPLTYGTGDGQSMLQGEPERVVELHSLSKLFGIEGLSATFIAGDRDVIEPIRNLGEYIWTPLSALQVEVAIHCLEDAETLRAIRERYAVRVRALSETLVGLGFDPYPAPSGLYVLCPTPRSVDGRGVRDCLEASESLLERFDVAALPWEGPDGGWLRFTAMCSDEDLSALRSLRLLDA